MNERAPELLTAIPGPRSTELSARLSRVESPVFDARREARAEESGEEQTPIVYERGDGANVFVAEAPVNVDIEQQDLMELAGVLLENAAKWAKSRVEITLSRDADGIETLIADDGPGLTPAQIATLGTRGRRLDESKKGSGLGLSIATEIVERNGGQLSFGDNPGGGLRVHLRLPVASPESPPS